MKRGQITLFVVLGLVLIFLIGIALYVYSNYNSVSQELKTSVSNKYADDPELQADYQANYERLSNCLKNVITDDVENFDNLFFGEEVRSLNTAENLLSEEILADFNTCFYKFNTENRMNVSATEEPEISVIISEDPCKVSATVSSLKINAKTNTGKNYVIDDDIFATKEIDICSDVEIRNKIQGDIDTLNNGGEVENPIVTPDCYINQYALEEECKTVSVDCVEGIVTVKDFCDLDDDGSPKINEFEVNGLQAPEPLESTEVLKGPNEDADGKTTCTDNNNCKVLNDKFVNPDVVGELKFKDGTINAGYYEEGTYEGVADETVDGERYVQFYIVII